MKFISTNGASDPVSFSEAVQRGLAPDGGLYMPESIPSLSSSFWASLENSSLHETAFQLAHPYMTDDFSDEEIRSIIEGALTFEAPVVPLYDSLFILELFHGPTLAFKDFGARFMAQVFSRLETDSDKDLLILVATSGDTGSAVAHGFYGVPGTRVCLLYPSGKVSQLQEKQMTTLGGNVTALEVQGTFDDCQKLVKQAFNDKGLQKELRLSSANSINFSRLLPQSFYYAGAWSALLKMGATDSGTTFTVPSGNFGNLTAGLLAREMGLPARTFLAATNINDVVPSYLESGEYRPRPSVQTLSNAMDVGDPSNFDRMMHLFDHNIESVRDAIHGYRFNDSQTISTIRRIYEKTGYTLDPHTAVGVMAAESFAESGSDTNPNVILSTAHPSKFADIVEEAIGQPVEIPERLGRYMQREKKTKLVGTEFDPFRTLLLDSFA